MESIYRIYEIARKASMAGIVGGIALIGTAFVEPQVSRNLARENLVQKSNEVHSAVASLVPGYAQKYGEIDFSNLQVMTSNVVNEIDLSVSRGEVNSIDSMIRKADAYVACLKYKKALADEKKVSQGEVNSSLLYLGAGLFALSSGSAFALRRRQKRELI